MTTTHIAANHVYICGRLIQRCAVCGEVLINTNLSRVSVPEADADKPLGTWTAGRMIRVTKGNPTGYVMLDDTGKLPDDTCFDLLENPDGD